MRLVLLTNQTTHHAFFLRELNCVYPVEMVLAETRTIAPDFNTFHPYEDQVHAYERKEFFSRQEPKLSELATTVEFDDLSSPKAVRLLSNLTPDVVVVFGTGPLKQDLLYGCPAEVVNLHGGDPEQYRGLDSHLWAIYHGQFEALITTLHMVAPRLDVGDIILQAPVPLQRDMQLCELRAANTRVCIDLVLAGLAAFERLGRFPARPQRALGRYYSFMPAALKGVCVKRFARHTKNIAS